MIGLIYPYICGFCGIILSKGYVCEECYNTIQARQNLIQIQKDVYYNKLICIYEYTGKVKEKIIQFKFYNKKYLYRTFSECICRKMEKINLEYDVIIPVPIHRKRYMQRGYNQSELLAMGISKICKVKIYRNLLVKNKDTLPQSSLNKDRRKTNVTGTYSINNKEVIKNKKILLVDDIYTTGATVNECSKILKESGAKEVIVLTLAKAV